MSLFIANSVGSKQKPRTAASDSNLSLHCLQGSVLWTIGNNQFLPGFASNLKKMSNPVRYFGL